MPGFEPKDQSENEKLAETCIQAIAGFGPPAQVATGDEMTQTFQKRYASEVLAQCWRRRNKWAQVEREPQPPAPTDQPKEWWMYPAKYAPGTIWHAYEVRQCHEENDRPLEGEIHVREAGEQPRPSPKQVT